MAKRLMELEEFREASFEFILVLPLLSIDCKVFD
jgi:hypothetical protein